MRRLRRLLISPEILVHLASGTFRVVANEVPDETRLVGRSYDPNGDAFVILIEHDTFDEVALGQEIPIHSPPMIERLPNVR